MKILQFSFPWFENKKEQAVFEKWRRADPMEKDRICKEIGEREGRAIMREIEAKVERRRET